MPASAGLCNHTQSHSQTLSGSTQQAFTTAMHHALVTVIRCTLRMHHCDEPRTGHSTPLCVMHYALIVGVHYIRRIHHCQTLCKTHSTLVRTMQDTDSNNASERASARARDIDSVTPDAQALLADVGHIIPQQTSQTLHKACTKLFQNYSKNYCEKYSKITSKLTPQDPDNQLQKLSQNY